MQLNGTMIDGIRLFFSFTLPTLDTFGSCNDTLSIFSVCLSIWLDVFPVFQMLLDTHAIKTLLLELPALGGVVRAYAAASSVAAAAAAAPAATAAAAPASATACACVAAATAVAAAAALLPFALFAFSRVLFSC